MRKSMINIHGIGWITKEGYGCIARGEKAPYKNAVGSDSVLRNRIFPYPFKNFGRLDRISKLTCYAIALAMKDAGISCIPQKKQDIGIVGAGASGSLQSDVDYFKDYLDCGRTLSRGNLFIYTLPSSPLGEAAIHFGLQGPLLYASSTEDPLRTAMTIASEIVFSGESPAILAGMTEGSAAVYFMLMKDSVSNKNILCDEKEISEILNKGMTFKKMIKELLNLRKGNN
jgi:3-oxoacyl-[acyl-carrier-protein] synthase II